MYIFVYSSKFLYTLVFFYVVPVLLSILYVLVYFSILSVRLCILAVGAIPSPFDCYLANRGLRTLHVRMRAHAENALAVAKYLEGSPLVENAIYPGKRREGGGERGAAEGGGEGGGRGGGEKGGRGEGRWEKEEHKIFLFQSSVIHVVIKVGDFKKMNE